MQMQLPGVLLPSLLLPPDNQGLHEESDFIKTLPEIFSGTYYSSVLSISELLLKAIPLKINLH